MKHTTFKEIDRKAEVKVDENQVFMNLLVYHGGCCFVEDLHDDITTLFTDAGMKVLSLLFLLVIQLC